MKYEIKYSTKFKKHYKKLNINEEQEVDIIITPLANDENLAQKYKDHDLQS